MPASSRATNSRSSNRSTPRRSARPADLADPGVKIVAAGDAVPITKYANQVVANLSTLNGYPAWFADAYAANIVSREDDVKAVVAKIELGEGDAAIVYRTDALAADAVAVMRIPEAANVAASYAGVAIKASAQPAEAAAFLDWLIGSAARRSWRPTGSRRPPREARARSGHGTRRIARPVPRPARGRPRGPRGSRWRPGGRARRSGRPGRAGPEPGDDRGQPPPDGRAGSAVRLCAGPSAVPRLGAARDHRRPADRAPAVGRGSRAAAGLRTARARRARHWTSSGSRSRSRPWP